MELKLTQSLVKFGRGMKRRSSRIVAWFAILTVIIGAGLIVCLPGGQAQTPAKQPDYSQVDDFLYGGRDLLRNDDLVLTFDYLLASGETRQVLFTAGTNNSSPNVLTYDQKTIPNGTAGCASSEGCNLDYHNRDDLKPVTGRFFNSVRDTTVLYPLQLSTAHAPLLVSMAGKTVGDSSPAAGLTWTTAQDVNFITGANAFYSAVADFNGDGYDDLVMAWMIIPLPNEQGNLQMRIATAVDVNDPGKGFTFGPQGSFEIDRDVTIIQDVEVGDFNGDFQPEIVTFIDAGISLDLATYSVNPGTLGISFGGQIGFGTNHNRTIRSGQVVTGQFIGTAHDQLVVAVQPIPDSNYYVHVVDFDPNSIQPVWKTTWTADPGPDLQVRLKAGRFNWGSPTEQIAWLDSCFTCGSRLSILTVDPQTLQISRRADIDTIPDPGSRYVAFDIAVGNFDRMQKSTADPTQLERDPDLQIALIGTRVNWDNASHGTAALYIFNVSDDYSTLTQASSVYLSQPYFGENTIQGMSITAGDVQGRSFRLGQGYKVTVDRAQPQVVLAMPPMHADYISPSGNNPPIVLNLSVAPDGFKSGFSQTTSTNASVTYHHTTSSSFSGEESIGSSFTLGETNPLTGSLDNGVKITDTFTAKQDIKASTEDINGAFNTLDFEISQETGLSDVIWFADTSYYLWVYPVIGRKVCPVDKPNCQESDKVPMQLMFSAPLPGEFRHLATNTIEWYQPPWEFGNILSYPAGLAQLKQYIPDIQLLTADTTVFATDDASAELKTTWANGSNTGQDVDHESRFTEDFDLSVEGATTVQAFGTGVGIESALNLNFGGSTGTKTLTETDTSFGSAQGISISKTASFTNSFLYKYLFSPFIFGKVKPVGYTDPINSSADLLTYGSLRSAYTVNPLQDGTGAWWSQSPYQSFPDVAVNHPNRWSYGSTPKPSNGEVPSNCVGLGNTFSMNCVTPTERDPENPWLDEFHDMRGLFITNKDNPPNSNPFVAGGGGAQLQTIKEKGQVTLTTRVYNYSFKAMPATTKVRVRFYGMLLNELNQPIGADGKVDFDGPSFLIGETVLNPIPPFNNDPSAPLNWLLASTNFDTTGRANQSVGLWVVVWMEDGNGNLVQELTSHGLTGNPSGAISSFAAITKFEEMVNNPLKQEPTDPDQISFSNNIGFYRSAFHILPATTSPSSLLKTSAVSLPTVKVERVDVSGTRLTPGGSVEGSVTLRNGAEELLGVMVYFYDGDPAQGGQLVDLERVGRLRSNGHQKVSFPFRPKTCGSHRLFVRVAPGRQYAEEGKASQQVRVDCSEPACFTRVCMKSPQYYGNNLLQLPQGKVTIAGRGFVSDVKTSNTTAMAKALKGGNGALVYFNQQYVTLQLSLLGTNDPNNDAERSNLLCYNARFPAVRLSTGAMLRPEMTIEDLFKDAKQTAKKGNAIDLRTTGHVMRLLNGEDPNGACRQ